MCSGVDIADDIYIYIYIICMAAESWVVYTLFLGSRREELQGGFFRAESSILKGSNCVAKRGYTEIDTKREAASRDEAPAARWHF